MTQNSAIYVIHIETPKWGFLKKDSLGQVEFLSPLPCPFNYGSLIGYSAKDGDWTDGILLGSRRKFGERVPATLVGVVHFIDKGQPDDKWIFSEDGIFSDSDLGRIYAFFNLYVIVKRTMKTISGVSSKTQFNGVVRISADTSSERGKSMSPFGFRKRLKDFTKGVLGLENADVTPPNWQSRPSNEFKPPQSDPKQSTPPVEAEPKQSTPPVEAEPQPSTSTEAMEEPVALSESEETLAEENIQPAVLEGPEITLEAVQEILDDMVRPALQGDGGDISLIKIESNDIYVRLVGACSTCPSSIMTMKLGVEALLKEEFPSMNELIDVTSAEA